MIKCIIVEDQPPAQRILKKYIEDVDSLQLEATFSDALQAMNFIQKNSIDLIFLDIHLPKLSGMDFLKTVPNAPHVILTTAFSEYAIESYEFNVIDYLLKPISFPRFLKAIAKIPSQENVVQSPTPSNEETHTFKKEIFIKSGYEYIKIRFEDILFIKSDADYSELFVSGKKHLSSEPLRYWEQTLDSKQFVRVHKSYIVHVAKIEKVVGNQIYLADGHTVPIGRAYKEKFTQQFLS